MPFLGVGMPPKDVAVSCEDVGVPHSMTRGCPFRVWSALSWFRMPLQGVRVPYEDVVVPFFRVCKCSFRIWNCLFK